MITFPSPTIVVQASFVSGSTYAIKTIATTNWINIGASVATIGTIFVYNGVAVTGSGGDAWGTYSVDGKTWIWTGAKWQLVPLGTASTRNVPTSGDAASAQVVLGSDTRLTGAMSVLATGSSTSRTLANRFADVVNVLNFGAHSTTEAGFETFDSTIFIQAALDSQQSILLPTGTYRITSELVFKIGSKLIGQGNWSGVSSLNSATGTSKILYDGPEVTNSCVIRMATQPVGTDIIAGTGAELQNCALTNVVIDGNQKADYGLYMVRAWSNNQLDYITVTGTKKHGFWAARCWNGSPTNWMAYKNIGCGITLGNNTFGWFSGISIISGGSNYAVNDTIEIASITGIGATAKISSISSGGIVTAITITNGGSGFLIGDTLTITTTTGTGVGLTGTARVENVATVDQSVCTSFFGYYSGVNSSTVRQNVFNTTTNSDKEYGIGIFGSRGLTMINAQSAQCGGAGLYLNTIYRPVLFLGGYSEFNGKSSGNTPSKSWDIWINSLAESWDITFNNYYLGGTPFIKLTGTEPSRIECGVIFERMPFLGTIEADWGNYRCIDSDRNVIFSNKVPNGFARSINGNFNLSIAGMAVFDASAGPITSATKYQIQGIISDVTYTSAGTYAVSLSPAFSSARYGIIVQTGDNRVASASSITTSGFNITNRTNNGLGTLTDGNARITVMVTGYYV